jgi:hypothetical protein
MKLFKTTVLFGGLLALATSLSAESALLTVSVPFEFVAGNTVMPAGNYTIEEPSIHGVLMLRGNQPNSTAIMIAVNGGPSTATHAGVTFSRRGSAIVLSTIAVPGGSNYSVLAADHKNVAAVNVALPRK